MNETMILRPVTIQDADMLLEWRNDAETRAASHNTAEVSPVDHIAWLGRVIHNPRRRLFIAEEDGRPVGTVRADFDETGIWELSWTTAPAERGRGVGKRMVALLAQQLDEPIRAEVKFENLASRAIARAAGMEVYGVAGGVLHYRRGATHSVVVQPNLRNQPFAWTHPRTTGDGRYS